MLRIAMGACIILTSLGCGHGAGGADLWQAVERDDGDAVRRYSAAGGDVNLVAWTSGDTPLWAALKQKKRHAYEAMLECGADPNIVMSGRRAVPHWAAREQDSWWLRLALEHGADPNLVNKGSGRPAEGTPLKFGLGHYGTLENVKLLFEQGADINKPDRFNCYPLASAFDQASYDVVLYFLDQGADFNRAECKGIKFVTHVKQLYDERGTLFRDKDY